MPWHNLAGCMPTYKNQFTLKLAQEFFKYFPHWERVKYSHKFRVSISSVLLACKHKIGFKINDLALLLRPGSHDLKLESHQCFIGHTAFGLPCLLNAAGIVLLNNSYKASRESLSSVIGYLSECCAHQPDHARAQGMHSLTPLWITWSSPTCVVLPIKIISCPWSEPPNTVIHQEQNIMCLS